MKQLPNEITVQGTPKLEDIKGKVQYRGFVVYTCPRCKKTVRKGYKWIIRTGFVCYDCHQLDARKMFSENSDIWVEKRRQNTLKKYGVKNTSQRKEIGAKIKQSHSERSIEAKNESEEKRKNTCLQKYGVTNPIKNTKVKEKRAEHWLDKYGVDNPWKLKQTKMNVRKNGLTRSTYIYDGRSFDSSWELQYYVYLIRHNKSFEYKPAPLQYEFENEVHLYFPDFRVDGEYVEIKGDQFLKDGKLQVPAYFGTSEKALQTEQLWCAKQHLMDFYKVKIVSMKAIKPIIAENTIQLGKNWCAKYKYKGENK